MILSTIKRYDFKGNHNVLLKTDFFIIDDYLASPNIVDIHEDRGSTAYFLCRSILMIPYMYTFPIKVI